MAHQFQSDGKVHGVIFGCRDDAGRWLMIRRSEHVPLPLKVCFPGGGVDAGETQHAACIREAREELGIEIQPLQPVWRFEFPNKPLILFGWSARLISKTLAPDPLEISEILWLTAEDGAHHTDGLSTNVDFINALETAMVANPAIQK